MRGRQTEGETNRAERRVEVGEGGRAGGNGVRWRMSGGEDGGKWRDGCSESAEDGQMKGRA